VIDQYIEIQNQLAELFGVSEKDLRQRFQLIQLSNQTPKIQFQLATYAIMVAVLDELEKQGKRTIDKFWWTNKYLEICGYDIKTVQEHLRRLELD
jgi:hypothetical protein